MEEKIDIDMLADVQPWFYHERVALCNPVSFVPPVAPLPYGFMNYKIDFGYSFLLRKMRTHFAQFDMDGFGGHTTFLNTMRIELTEKAFNIVPQNLPTPLNLCTTPASEDVIHDPMQVGNINDLTATAPKADKLINKLFPHGSNIHIIVTGNEALVPKIFPFYVHIVLIGYLIPDRTLSMWGKNG